MDYYAFFGLGSNLGDRESNLISALSLIKSCLPSLRWSQGSATDVDIIAVSNIYSTSPVCAAAEDDGDFLNCAVLCRIGVRASNVPGSLNSSEFFSKFGLELLRELKKIEETSGRKLNAPRYSPRTIDIDILRVFGPVSTDNDNILSLPELNIPHKEMLNRKFVLMPLMDILKTKASLNFGDMPEEVKKALKNLNTSSQGRFQQIKIYGSFSKNLAKILLSR